MSNVHACGSMPWATGLDSDVWQLSLTHSPYQACPHSGNEEVRFKAASVRAHAQTCGLAVRPELASVPAAAGMMHKLSARRARKTNCPSLLSARAHRESTRCKGKAWKARAICKNLNSPPSSTSAKQDGGLDWGRIIGRFQTHHSHTPRRTIYPAIQTASAEHGLCCRERRRG